MKIIEMLRMSESGLSQREIAASSGCGKSTVGEVLKLCRERGITYEAGLKLKDEELHRTLYPKSPAAQKASHPEPDWKAIHEELAKHKNLNLQFMWEEYIEKNGTGLSYSRFCAHYRKYRKESGRQVSLHHERKAGEIMEVDWMGDTLACVADGRTGEAAEAHFFVATIGYSLYPYAEAFPNELEASWIAANVNALHYYNGVPRMIVPDNCRTAVKTPKYYEPTINSAYWELAQHYEVAIVPARIKKARDKPVVEHSVGWLETWLLGKLRNQMFFSFHELNKEIIKHIQALSAKPFQKREGSRLSEFIKIDMPALRPLPAQRYELAEIAFRKVGDNYHVEFDNFWYSTPYSLHGEKVVVRATAAAIEIIDRNHVRMACHRRRYSASDGRYSTMEEHMPPNHKAVHQSRQFDGGRYRKWAERIGENTCFIIESLLSSGAVEEQGYRACMGVLQLSNKYSEGRLESACGRARQQGTPTYSAVKGILKSGLEDIPAGIARPTPEHGNIRGGGYYS